MPQRSGVRLKCENCGDEFYVPQYRANEAKYCTWDCKQAVEKDTDKIRERKRWFTNQRDAAKVRGIGWNLTFEEWLNIWINSGHLHERGQASHEYCMSRHGDKGKYEIGNVRIITNKENIVERKSPKGEDNVCSKLTEKDVYEIRALEGKMKRKDVAVKFNLNIWHVRDIQKRKSWSWLEDKPKIERVKRIEGK
jgi:hypothetical protein